MSVNPAELKPNLQPPLVMIESVLVDGREQKTNRLDSAWPQSIVIPPGHDQLEIHYTALNFSAPDAVRFKYRLEGHETAWTEAGDTRVAFYNKLPPGNYRFHVKACNEDGVWNETGSVLAVTVQPQFWQTGWFRAAVILGFLGIVAAVVRYLSTQKLQRQLQALKQREALEKERSRIARDLHDQLGANLTQVALLGEMAEADKNSPGGNRVARAANFPDRARNDALARRNRLGGQSFQRHAGRPDQLRLQIRAGISRAGRIALPRRCAGPIAGESSSRRKSATTSFSPSRRPSTTSSNTRRRPKPGFDCGCSPDNFTLEIEDNGRGLGRPDAPRPQTRNGLRNMRKRMEDIHGEFSISGGAKGGTMVRLTVPISNFLNPILILI